MVDRSKLKLHPGSFWNNDGVTSECGNEVWVTDGILLDKQIVQAARETCYDFEDRLAAANKRIAELEAEMRRRDDYIEGCFA